MGLAKSPAEPSEDAAAFDLGRGRIALSDGASRALGSREWARCLVQTFVAEPPSELTDATVRAWAAAAGREWTASLEIPDDAPPYVRDAAARGSFATLLGIVVDPAPPGANSVWWRAVAVGDTCLFALRDEMVVEAFPLDSADQFGSVPDLVPTSGPEWENSLTELRTTRGSCGPGDVLLLMTDALAKWALGRAPHGGDVWRFLSRVVPDELENTVCALWARGELEQDDVTLVRCRAAVTA
ncbi:hypothetical protein GCM10010334_62130 [Streptomyces finlayi]|uniref:PPM-type phosphatase domain-containing protein n=2 Tax=Streptomyces finlayi TaxID=67296 RepID=A0A919CD48_9ACTN|nr:hypothetical protein GCM10010334_62130 [Streptomyces finlayi]